MTNNKIEQKARERLTHCGETYHSAWTDSAALRYMSNDFPGYVFETENQCKLLTKLDRENFDNHGKAYAAQIGPYQTPSGKVKAEVSYMEQRHDNTHKLATVAKSEVFESTEKAKEWIGENGIDLSEYPTVDMEQYRNGDSPNLIED